MTGPDYVAGQEPDPEGPADRARAAEGEGVTAREQRNGRSLEDRLGEEEPDDANRPSAEPPGTELVDEDRPDDEPDLVAATTDEPPADSRAEDLAVDVRESAPAGTTDHPDDYVEDAAETRRDR